MLLASTPPVLGLGICPRKSAINFACFTQMRTAGPSQSALVGTLLTQSKAGFQRPHSQMTAVGIKRTDLHLCVLLLDLHALAVLLHDQTILNNLVANCGHRLSCRRRLHLKSPHFQRVDRLDCLLRLHLLTHGVWLCSCSLSACEPATAP